MQARTRNSSVSSQALYHRATASPLLFEEGNVVLLPQLCHTGLLVISFAVFFFFFFFTANYVDAASSGSSFEPCHKIAAINVA